MLNFPQRGCLQSGECWLVLVINTCHVRYCLGDLRQPSKAIPKGTLAATTFTLATYLIETLLIASAADR